MTKFVSAWESADLDVLVTLLTDEVFISMPPMPFEYQGRDLVARFFAGIFGADRRFDLLRTRANGQPAFGSYLRTPGGVSHGVGLYASYARRRPDLRHDSLREQRAPMVRFTAIGSEPVVSVSCQLSRAGLSTHPSIRRLLPSQSNNLIIDHAQFPSLL